MHGWPPGQKGKRQKNLRKARRLYGAVCLFHGLCRAFSSPSWLKRLSPAPCAAKGKIRTASIPLHAPPCPSCPHIPHIPIVVLSANAFREDVEASLASGMEAHMTKPLEQQCCCTPYATSSTTHPKPAGARRFACHCEDTATSQEFSRVQTRASRFKALSSPGSMEEACPQWR